MMMKEIKQRISVKLVRSVVGSLPKHKATVCGLGLRRLNQTVVLEDTACVRGMINKVSHLVAIEQA